MVSRLEKSHPPALLQHHSPVLPSVWSYFHVFLPTGVDPRYSLINFLCTNLCFRFYSSWNPTWKIWCQEWSKKAGTMIWIRELATHCWLAMTHWWQVEHNCHKKAEQLLNCTSGVLGRNVHCCQSMEGMIAKNIGIWLSIEKWTWYFGEREWKSESD